MKKIILVLTILGIISAIARGDGETCSPSTKELCICVTDGAESGVLPIDGPSIRNFKENHSGEDHDLYCAKSWLNFLFQLEYSRRNSLWL